MVSVTSAHSLLDVNKKYLSVPAGPAVRVSLSLPLSPLERTMTAIATFTLVWRNAVLRFRIL